jgi:hypothetical protein
LDKDINDKEALSALVDVVVTFAPELVLMPATPRIIKDSFEIQKMWDVSVTNKETGKTMSEAEL